MPSPSISACFAFLLTTVFDEEGFAFADPFVLRQFELETWPTNITGGVLPRGIPDIETRNSIAEYLDTARNENDGLNTLKWLWKGETCNQGRLAWQQWFRTSLAGRLNILLDEKLHEAGLHPYELLASYRNDSSFPDRDIIIGNGAQYIAEVFGDCIFNGGHAFPNAHFAIKSLLVHVVDRHQKAFERARRTMYREHSVNAPVTESTPAGLWPQLEDVMKGLDDQDTPEAEIVEARQRALQLIASIKKYLDWCPHKKALVDGYESICTHNSHVKDSTTHSSEY